MELTADQRLELVALKRKTSCSKRFRCLALPPSQLCSARDLGMDGFLECLQPNSQHCSHSFPFGEGRFCRCAIRVFLAKQFPPGSISV